MFQYRKKVKQLVLLCQRYAKHVVDVLLSTIKQLVLLSISRLMNPKLQ